jgi:peptidoglycan/LPS O-acetylase OafA/YrhL
MGVNHARGDRGVDVVKNIFSGVLYGQGRELFIYSVVDMVAAGVLLATIGDSRGTRWLSTPWISAIGRISYGGYLFHAAALSGVSFLIGQELKYAPVSWRIAGFGLVYAVTLLLASLSFNRLEQPIARRFRLWASADRVVSARVASAEH